MTEREHHTVTNIWDDDLREIGTEQLVAMHDVVTDAVQLSYDDEDVEALAILLPLEGKIVQVLHSRL